MPNQTNGYDEIVAPINQAIDDFITARDEMRSVHKADKIQTAQAESDVCLAAVLHYQAHGDYRPLGRIICQVKPNKKVIRAIRMSVPGLAIIKQVDKSDNNRFMVSHNDGFNHHEDSGFFNQSNLNAWADMNTTAKADNASPYDNKATGWDNVFPDVAPKDLDKLQKSMTKALTRKVEDLKKRGQMLTQEQMMQCVRDAYAALSQADPVIDGEPAH